MDKNAEEKINFKRYNPSDTNIKNPLNIRQASYICVVQVRYGLDMLWKQNTVFLRID